MYGSVHVSSVVKVVSDFHRIRTPQTRVDMIDAPKDHHDGGTSSKLTVPKINPADSVMGEWVMVDMVREVG